MPFCVSTKPDVRLTLTVGIDVAELVQHAHHGGGLVTPVAQDSQLLIQTVCGERGFQLVAGAAPPQNKVKLLRGINASEGE